MALENLVTKIGSLASTYPLFKPNTVQCADEICRDRLPDTEEARKLRNTSFYVANSALYTIEGDDEIFYFSEGKTARRLNPLFRANVDESCKQLINNQDYIPPKKHIEDIVNSVKTGETKRFVLSRLGLQRFDDEWSYFEINTANYEKQLNKNKEQKQFAEMAFGSMEKKKDKKTKEVYSDFGRYINLLKKEGKTKIRMYVLNPDYVKKNVKQGSVIVRACWLNLFDDYSNFGADGRGVVINLGLRGVLKGAEGAQKNNALKTKIPKQSEIFGIFAPYLGSANKKETRQKLGELFNKYNN